MSFKQQAKLYTQQYTTQQNITLTWYNLYAAVHNTPHNTLWCTTSKLDRDLWISSHHYLPRQLYPRTLHFSHRWLRCGPESYLSSTAIEFIIKTVVNWWEGKRQVGRHTDIQKDNGRSFNYYATTLAVIFLFPNSSGLYYPSKLCVW